jgi:hypothetical protein
MRCDATRSDLAGRKKSLGVWRSRGVSLRDCPDRGVQLSKFQPTTDRTGVRDGSRRLVGVDDGGKDGESDLGQRDGKDFLFLTRLARIPPP